MSKMLSYVGHETSLGNGGKCAIEPRQIEKVETIELEKC